MDISSDQYQYIWNYIVSNLDYGVQIWSVQKWPISAFWRKCVRSSINFVSTETIFKPALVGRVTLWNTCRYQLDSNCTSVWRENKSVWLDEPFFPDVRPFFRYSMSTTCHFMRYNHYFGPWWKKWNFEW